MLDVAIPQKERMLKIVKAGYSCTTELAVCLIREHNYGGRAAHSVVATMVRNARCKGLKSYECTGAMLDEAARYLEMKEPGLTDEEVKKQLDPEEFVKTHTNLGGTAQKEKTRTQE
jgi:argininosuccinate lyase